MSFWFCVLYMTVGGITVIDRSAVLADDVSFSRDVLPVLSDRCFHCHGPDEGNREADLRLDIEQNAKEDLGGYAAVTGGDLESSEIWQRITSDDEDMIMPPSDSHRKPLSEAEREAIRQWILSGAKWGKHWSFEKLQRPEVPDPESHPVDAFVAAKLASKSLSLSERAEPHVQLRRLSFDLTGLAPTAEDLAAFGDGRGDSYERAIERLLDSPRYGERMAMWWLDAARYSDSDGFQIDETRQNWPWRDWVIQQFQQNRSFRDFTIEQFAGDLLPNATPEQRLATCFHRNHMTNGEGGRDPEESRIDYVIDRVNTTGTVWLGLTLGCVQCHSHKFDPISQHDYYRMSAFFNSIDENGRAGMKAEPYLDFQSSAVLERIAEMKTFLRSCEESEQAERGSAEKRFESWLKELKSGADPEFATGKYQTWWTPTPKVSSTNGTVFHVETDGVVQTSGPTPMHDDYRIAMALPKHATQITGIRVEVFPSEQHEDGRFTRDGNGEFTLTSVLAAGRRAGSPSEQQTEIRSAVSDYDADEKRKTEWDTRYSTIAKTLNDDARDGWTTEGAGTVESHVGVFELENPWLVQEDDQFIFVLRHRSTHGHANIGRFRVSLTTEPGETLKRTDGGSPLAESIEKICDETDLDADLRQRLLEQFLLNDRSYQATALRLERAKRQLAELEQQNSPRKVMVLAERSEPRETHVLVRGVWDAKGDQVEPGVLPSVFASQDGEMRSRLDLAKWIMNPENPLTARVVANQLWQILFGSGLVRTPDDFGLQGELPTHPKLLDWLAVELIESDWDLQHVIRIIATSETYRQSSHASPELLELDPENRLLARAPRFRLPAWMIRDNALHVSGLLNGAVGGPPVKPYQPEGVWSEITMGRFSYEPSLGPAQYRRTVYAFWRRSSAPTFLFDSAQRRVCEVGVRRTNTPLQALTLMNDVAMLEASRVLADAAVAESDNDGLEEEGILTKMARRVLSRDLSSPEQKRLNDLWNRAEGFYSTHLEDAVQYGTVGQQAAPEESDAVQTASWMAVASLLLNLDEAMTRE